MALVPQPGANVHFQDVSRASALITCVGLSSLFVILINVVSRRARDHPETVIRRLFIACGVMPVVSTVVLWALATQSTAGNVHAKPFHEWLGFRSGQLLYAAGVPLLLVTVGYSGDYLHACLDGDLSLDWCRQLFTPIGVRNFIGGPLSEEYVFRSCMLPLLLPHFSVTTCVFLAPAVFGIAHVHLAWESYRRGDPIAGIAALALLRLCYTTLFGSFTTFLFLRTGHLLSCCLAHVYCNILGLPNFADIPSHRYRTGLIAAHIVAMAAFFYLLGPLTDPVLFDSQFSSLFTASS